MVNPSSDRTRNAVRRGALGLALALPLLTSLPARAQAETDSDQSSEEQIQLEDALTGENTDPQSAPQAVEVESFEGLEEAPVAAEDDASFEVVDEGTLINLRFVCVCVW